MNAYIWYNTRPVSSAYHDDGSLLIVASDIDRARTLWQNDFGGSAAEGEPDVVIRVAGDERERVMVFPNAGCC